MVNNWEEFLNMAPIVVSFFRFFCSDNHMLVGSSWVGSSSYEVVCHVQPINHLPSELWFSLRTWSSLSMINNQSTLALYQRKFHTTNHQYKVKNAYCIMHSQVSLGLLHKTHDHVLYVYVILNVPSLSSIANNDGNTLDQIRPWFSIMRFSLSHSSPSLWVPHQD